MSALVRCPACGRTIDPLRAGQMGIHEGAFVYFCDRACKDGFETGTPVPVATKPKRKQPMLKEALELAPELLRDEALESEPAPQVAPSSPALALLGDAQAMTVGDAADDEAPASDQHLTPAPSPAVNMRSVSQPVRDSQAGPQPERASDHGTIRAFGETDLAANGRVRALGIGSLVMALLALALGLLGPTLAIARLALTELSVLAGCIWLVVTAPRSQASGLVWLRRAQLFLALVGPGVLLAVAHDHAFAGDWMTQAAFSTIGIGLTEWLVQNVEAHMASEGEVGELDASRQSGHANAMEWLGLAVQIGAIVLSLIGNAAQLASTQRLFALACTLSAFVSFRALRSLLDLAYHRINRDLMAGGVTYSTAEAIDRAAKTRMLGVFGISQLLTEAPVLEKIVPIGRSGSLSEQNEVLALASALTREMKASSLTDAIVEVAAESGLPEPRVHSIVVTERAGIIAKLKSGEPVALGGRAFFLEQRISLARTDDEIRALLDAGNRILYLAKNERVIAALAFAVAPRADVQESIAQLADAGVETLVVSGETREVCDEISLATGLQHVRPEVYGPSAQERVLSDLVSTDVVLAAIGADEAVADKAHLTLRLAPTGQTEVALLGHRLGTASATLTEASMRAVALALTIPIRAHKDLRRVLLTCAAAALPALLLLALGLVPGWAAPVLSLVTSVIALGPKVPRGKRARG
jgi:phosphoglycolate phosphatase-like HAD superfamily hydrolase